MRSESVQLTKLAQKESKIIIIKIKIPIARIKNLAFEEILFRGAGKSEFLKLQTELKKISEQISSGQDFEKLAIELGRKPLQKKGGLWNGYTFEFLPKQYVNLKTTLNSLQKRRSVSTIFR